IGVAAGLGNGRDGLIRLPEQLLRFLNPHLMDVGFQLSAGATAGLGLLYRKIHERIPGIIPEIIKETISATIAAQAGVLPMLILYFSRVSVVSLISNLFVVPLTGITTVIGMISVIIDNVNLQLGQYCSYALQALLHIILFVTNSFASIPWAQLNMKHWNILWILFYYTLLVITGFSSVGFFTRHKNKVTVCIFILGVVLLVQSFIPDNLKITFIDVGQGDSALVKTAGGVTMLIDGGGSYNELDTLYIGQSVIFPVLMHEEIGKLDYVIITHADADHMYGILTLMDIYPVKKAVLPDYKEAYRDFSVFIELCREKGTEILFLSASDTIQLDDFTEFEILYPGKGASDYSNLNNVSLCGMLKYRQFQLLFTGDMEKEAENNLLRIYPDIDCDVLKVSHHGGKNGTSDMFLDAACPEAAVISVGKNNYGHPSGEVLDRLYKAEAKVYTTLNGGAVILESDGLYYKIKTWLKNERFTFLN
ncbi:MAG: DNA internalization-related competence protein ComEC/Rec2, partial [Clostridiaceae bacterium]|nr:DNA internalization-related competence protein ComEC/Rec2 [Clostridiaceae bacterium]